MNNNKKSCFPLNIFVVFDCTKLHVFVSYRFILVYKSVSNRLNYYDNICGYTNICFLLVSLINKAIQVIKKLASYA